jgi:hypothetical protein
MNKPTVKIRKLGRQRAYGLYHDGGLIEIDPRVPVGDHLRVLIHEYLHHAHPEWTEEKVDTLSTTLAEFLWENSYRRVLLE